MLFGERNKAIAKNYIAGSTGLGISFLNQIALVPLFIGFWGVERYSDWILISAFSSFFSMTDMGLNSVSTNEFVIRYQRKEYEVCRKLLTNMFVLIVAVGMICIGAAGIFAYLGGFKGLLAVSVFSEFETSYVFIVLLMQIFVKMYGGVYNGIYRAASYAHRGMVIDNTVRLCELLILCAGLWSDISIVIIITIYLLPVLSGVVYRHIDSKKWFYVRFSTKHFDVPLLKSLVKPALGFMALPVGHAMSNQGMIFIVSNMLGSVALVSFTTTRSLVNFLRAVTNILGAAVGPEISVAYGRGDLKTMKSIYQRSFYFTLISSGACAVLLLFFGKPIYLAWTRHAVEFHPMFFYGMLAVLVASCLWGITSVILSAINKHMEFSIAFLLSVVLGAGLCYLALLFYPDLSVISIGLLVPEVLLLGYVTKKTKQLFISENKP